MPRQFLDENFRHDPVTCPCCILGWLLVCAGLLAIVLLTVAL